jgi:hypothetical protein
VCWRAVGGMHRLPRGGRTASGKAAPVFSPGTVFNRRALLLGLRTLDSYIPSRQRRRRAAWAGARRANRSPGRDPHLAAGDRGVSSQPPADSTSTRSPALSRARMGYRTPGLERVRKPAVPAKPAGSAPARGANATVRTTPPTASATRSAAATPARRPPVSAG